LRILKTCKFPPKGAVSEPRSRFTEHGTSPHNNHVFLPHPSPFILLSICGARRFDVHESRTRFLNANGLNPSTKLRTGPSTYSGKANGMAVPCSRSRTRSFPPRARLLSDPRIRLFPDTPARWLSDHDHGISVTRITIRVNAVRDAANGSEAKPHPNCRRSNKAMTKVEFKKASGIC
jgi:hypothetical protein